MNIFVNIFIFFLLFFFQLVINRFFFNFDLYGTLFQLIIICLFFFNFFIIFFLRTKLSKNKIIFLFFSIILSIFLSQSLYMELEKKFQYLKVNYLPQKLVYYKNKLSDNKFDEKKLSGENFKIEKINNNLNKYFQLLFFFDNFKSGILTNKNELSIKYLGHRKDSRAHFIKNDKQKKLISFTNAYSDRNIIYMNQYDQDFNFINQKWKKSYKFDNHQWLNYYQNLLIVPGSNYTFHPLENLTLNLKYSNFKNCKGKIRIDTIELLDFNTGKHLKSINILEKIFKIDEFDNSKLIIDCLDPTHVTNIEVIDNVKKASYFPNGKVGDLLISLREMNTLILLDKDTFEVKWYLFDKTKKQFSTLMTDDGYILILDNMSKSALNGTTRIISFDVTNNKIHSSYEATDNKILDIKYRGKMQMYEDSLMLSDSLNGKLRQLKCTNISKLENCSDLITIIDFNEKFYLVEFYN